MGAVAGEGGRWRDGRRWRVGVEWEVERGGGWFTRGTMCVCVGMLCKYQTLKCIHA